MRFINSQDIIEKVAAAVIKANTVLPTDVFKAIANALVYEDSLTARNIIEIILQNAHIAESEGMAICQDTGLVVVNVCLGQDVHIVGTSLETAINEGVRIAYKAGYFRNSVVNDPILRVNTNDNTPVIINYQLVSGKELSLTISPKGAGSENMGQLAMLKPLVGLKGVKDFVLEVVKKASANPCPPIIVGVGIGGNMEKAVQLAKGAVLRPINLRNELAYLADFELELLKAINELGIGPQGLGGRTTALAVNVEVFATHIASLPVAVNLSCHATRRVTIRI
ncbi:MAG: fumarate hydratase [Syntrophomonadaceae bacterium]|nr:fumarate hydratase [Syntrophomonadaceae bacterium]